MIVKKKFPAKVACVHCNGGCRAKKSEEGYDLCTYGCTGCGACIDVCRFGVALSVLEWDFNFKRRFSCSWAEFMYFSFSRP